MDKNRLRNSQTIQIYIFKSVKKINSIILYYIYYNTLDCFIVINNKTEILIQNHSYIIKIIIIIIIIIY